MASLPVAACTILEREENSKWLARLVFRRTLDIPGVILRTSAPGEPMSRRLGRSEGNWEARASSKSWRGKWVASSETPIVRLSSAWLKASVANGDCGMGCEPLVAEEVGSDFGSVGKATLIEGDGGCVPELGFAGWSDGVLEGDNRWVQNRFPGDVGD